VTRILFILAFHIVKIETIVEYLVLFAFGSKLNCILLLTHLWPNFAFFGPVF